MTSYSERSDQLLSELLDRLDNSVGDVADVDLLNEILTVTLDDGRVIIINKNNPLREIWVSAPQSGAAHFREEGSDWICTKTGTNLNNFLTLELQALLNRSLV